MPNITNETKQRYPISRFHSYGGDLNLNLWESYLFNIIPIACMQDTFSKNVYITRIIFIDNFSSGSLLKIA